MNEIVTDEEVLGGDPRLEGTRIGVIHVYRQYEQGETPEQIAANYEGVTVADVHVALAYAFDNSEEIRQIEEQEREVLKTIRDQRPEKPNAEHLSEEV
ncbi:DUF433 domain-containing protein [Saliphagus infecundisoli]|uniref:DUF433 domain-containing protein n=1 Tax=Saliphagus infecundisoli TaxID=1849069 RepID=A0ABD5QB03_9EURY|nr:DUF433 domain-containing protein [Saliphagus infecundisoli]